MSQRPHTIRKQIHVTGIVQGVGFRPFVWNRAYQLGLVGWVKNDSTGVTIEIEGTPAQIDRFISDFETYVPSLARIDSISVTEIPTALDAGFQIIPSSLEERRSTPVSSEISVCDECRDEMQDPADRRYRYPFINCTNCGPRFTIIEDIPYDRPLTTMKSFSMCRRCQQEYDDPGNRRFHAQPNACPECGPRIWFVSDPLDKKGFESGRTDQQSDFAIDEFRMAINQGHIVGVKGIGGFHLACDATNDAALEKLRTRKGRVDKPLAMMVFDIDQAKNFVHFSNHERALLASKERPIVLLQKKIPRKHRGPIEESKRINGVQQPIAGLSELVSPGNNFVGVMLPYSPLHYLLLENSPPLIMTSGNLTDEPIARTNDEAHERLIGLADFFLLHDRDIHVVCDDSVVRSVEDNRILPIRRSRGYAPVPVKLAESGPSVLAIGGEIKSTFCVTKDDYAYVSQHIGDMGNLETLEAMQRNIDHFIRLFRVEIEAVVADLHPDYLSGQWAQQFAQSRSLPFIRVQHHFAHVASLIAEHQATRTAKESTEMLQPAVAPAEGIPKLADLRDPIIGVCFDGTGFGTDDAIWGGEILIADDQKFTRFANLNYVPLPGGDTNIRRPYRAAMATLWAAGINWDPRLPCVADCPQSEANLLGQQLQKNLRCIPTSSMGRHFDSVASILGIRQEVTYEAQAAMEMEALAEECIEQVDPKTYSYSFCPGPVTIIEFQNLIRQICRDVIAGERPSILAARFHHAVANMVAEACKRARMESNIDTIGLTGGVFQNVLLLKLTRGLLVDNGFEVLTHATVPPNDGGLALGQALVARTKLRIQ